MGKSGTNKYPKRGDKVAAKHSEEFDKMDMGQKYNEKKLARLDRKSDRIQKRINKQ